ncbi:MAG: lamin tail domain-containing protein [Prevotellaceae bacterium]|jgi:Na+-transporting methylmalonyl-CoA/oxaloacetate decarboxylase gamma subunit|nr:lamin tail domain-containing protein [Prevotellaceae bacterium]
MISIIQRLFDACFSALLSPVLRNGVGRRGLAALAVAMLWSSGAQGQRTTDLRLNEFMAINETNYEDDFGEHSSWIEIFNSSYGTLNIGGCYLSDDINDLKKYPIPKGDVLTSIKPRQHVIFWADNKPTHGTFHLNFKIDDTRFLALTSSDGRTIIDSITYPEQAANVSYGRSEDGTGAWGFCERTTPSTNNTLVKLEAASDRFKTYDPSGIAMTITAMSVVFLALISLFLIFKYVGKTALWIIALRGRRIIPQESPAQVTVSGEKQQPSPGAVFAAIAYALRQYELEVSELESNILTINKVAKAYSPWNSKIYTLRETPVKKG